MTGKGKRVPNALFANRKRSLLGQPDEWFDAKANDVRIAFRKEQGGLVNVRFAEDIKDADPATKLGHVANELIAFLNAPRPCESMFGKPGRAPFRTRKRLVCARGKKVRVERHLSAF